LDLTLNTFCRGRQQALEPKPLPLLLGERRPLVEGGVVQQGNPSQGARSRMRRVVRHAKSLLGVSGLDHLCALLSARAIGRTESERTPCAPWISTPSMSAVADGPV